jgi:hypothetical protein
MEKVRNLPLFSGDFNRKRSHMSWGGQDELEWKARKGGALATKAIVFDGAGEWVFYGKLAAACTGSPVDSRAPEDRGVIRCVCVVSPGGVSGAGYQCPTPPAAELGRCVSWTVHLPSFCRGENAALVRC